MEVLALKAPVIKDELEIQVRSGEIPGHIAVIMDGNGRWANNKGRMRVFGHKAGVESVRNITETCAELGVRYLTLYAFSTENWARPTSEVNALMRILFRSLRNETERLNENNIRLITIGETEKLPQSCRYELARAMERTQHNTGMVLCLALSYSGRWDIAQATRTIAEKVSSGELNASEIGEETIAAHLSTAGIPDPDLIIRTSGEHRISNFLLWQLAYSEWVITDTLWPDFRKQQLLQAVAAFQHRERRFGMTSDQIRPTTV